jgi:LITAF-like zinc ribbon domain
MSMVVNSMILLFQAVILTHLVAILLIPVLGCWIPYVFHCLQVIRHRCPICDVQLGVSTIF